MEPLKRLGLWPTRAISLLRREGGRDCGKEKWGGEYDETYKVEGKAFYTKYVHKSLRPPSLSPSLPPSTLTCNGRPSSRISPFEGA